SPPGVRPRARSVARPAAVAAAFGGRPVPARAAEPRRVVESLEADRGRPRSRAPAAPARGDRTLVGATSRTQGEGQDPRGREAREGDLPAERRARVAARLADLPGGARAARMLHEPVPLDRAEEGRLLDESLPAGLRVRASAA